MKRVFCVAALAAAALAAPVSAQQLTDGTVKLGVLTDMSSLYSDINGPGAVIAVQMAIEDFGGSIGGKKIEMVQADVQNKADVAATISGRWYDTEGVDAILGSGGPNAAALRPFALFHDPGCDLDARRPAELAEDPLDVDPDRARRDE